MSMVLHMSRSSTYMLETTEAVSHCESRLSEFSGFTSQGLESDSG